ncbi:MAG: putative phosphoribosyltransferase [Polyangiaceae bacterium]|jgi:predicted phosphoribosyltransferase|nr:putative phosphoribosyltransferase [Polyangiaceae bacterium]
MPMPFRNRRDAGRRLADELQRFEAQAPVVLALPRGGVPVAYEVATRFRAPLDVLIVRKLGAPRHPELAMGAIASGGAIVLNREILNMFHVSDDALREETARQAEEVARRSALYRGDRPAPDVRGRTVLLIDDGLATGATMKAGVEALRQYDPARVVVGVPIAAPEGCQLMSETADEVVCAETPAEFLAVGMWYQDFEQTTDREVIELLAAARQERSVAGHLSRQAG